MVITSKILLLSLEAIKSDVRGLGERDGGGITGFPPHVTTREGKGEKMDMDGCNNGEGRAKDISDGIPERRGKDLPS